VRHFFNCDLLSLGVLTGDLIEIEDCHIAAVLKNGEVLAAAGEMATM